MAVMALFDHPDIHKEHYETLRREVNWERQHADGGVVHIAAFDEKGGIHVTDVWESPDALNAFVANRLMPVMQKHNMPQPNVRVFPTYNINALPSVEKHILRK